jgi:hypothetical protein
MHFISILVRYLDEPYIQEFIDHYLAEGVSHIYILYDTKSRNPLPNSVITNPQISVRNAYNINSNPKHNLWREANEWYRQVIRRQTEWFLYVDCDEFISTYKRFPNMTLRRIIQNCFKNVDCIKIPWVMMSCNKRTNDPPSILQNITHRWNHNYKHPHPNRWKKGECRYHQIQVKCIFKAANYKHFNDHFPDASPKINPLCVNSVNGRREIHSTFFQSLREYNIREAALLCFHYRIISKESCLRKTENNGFEAYNNNWQSLMNSDHPDMIENHLREKSIQRFGPKNYICPSP